MRTPVGMTLLAESALQCACQGNMLSSSCRRVLPSVVLRGLSKRQHAPGSERVLHDVHGIVMHPIDEIFVALTLPPPPLPSLVRGT